MPGKKYPPNEHLRHARELRGWGQKAVAEKLSATRDGETQIVVDERAVRRWETGESLPAPFYRQRLCEVFGMNAQELGFLPPTPVLTEPSLPAVPEEKVPPAALAAPRDKNRQRLLKKVQTFWIAGVLERSLYDAVLLQLGLEEQPDALANPWELAVQQTELPARPLPPDTTIEAVYDQAQGEVLILGAPGAGKTTLLLELTRHLLERATRDETQPLPVVLHLSSWAVQRHPLEQWLVEELHDKYQVPRPLGQTWVEDDQLLLLLDGLDEVEPAFRTACIEAINAYTPNHSVPLVVCSRRAEYLAQTARLRLTTAVLVQPLTSEQIDRYLEQLGEPLSSVRSAIQHDPNLQELVQTPLMLSILILASQGQPVKELLTTSSVESQQRQLFTVYVERMLQRRGPATRYTPQQTAHWLTWLARRLKEHSQSVFYLESMQPDWLPEGWSSQLYQSLLLRFWASLVIGVIFGMRFGLSIAIQTTIFLGLLIWLGTVLTFTLVGAVVVGPCAFLVEWVLAKWLPPLIRRVFSGLLSGLLGGLVSGWLVLQVFILFYPPFGYPFHPTFGEAIYLVIGPAVLSNSILGLVGTFERRPAAPVRLWSWSNAWKTLREALLIGLIGGVGSQALVQGLYLLAEHTTIAIFVRENNKGLLQQNSNLPLDTVLVSLNIVAYALPSLFFTSSIEQAIRPVEVVTWSWRRARQGILYGVGLGLLFGSVILLSISGLLHGGGGHSFAYNVIFAVFFLLFGGFLGVLFGGLSGGVSKNILEERARVRPNQLIWRSARNGGRAGVISGLIWAVFLLLVSVGSVLYFQFYDELVNDVVFSLLVGTLLGALIGSIWVGGLACLQHVLLRFLLWWTKQAPWNYPRFLNYTAERILLQKVGGGYMFIHRLLLDHFALLETTATTPTEAPQEPQQGVAS